MVSASPTTGSCCCSTRRRNTVSFNLPGVRYGREWEVVIDTFGPRVPALHDELPPVLNAKAQAKVAGRAVMVLRCRTSGRS